MYIYIYIYIYIHTYTYIFIHIVFIVEGSRPQTLKSVLRLYSIGLTCQKFVWQLHVQS